ncbi:MAG: hypothetical protein U0174_28240 [Polyangiaceae bacterium]
MSEKHLPLQTREEIEPLWTLYRTGEAGRCPRDGGNIALAVEGSSRAYRLVCTQCGISTPWFEPTKNGVVVKAPYGESPEYDNNE